MRSALNAAVIVALLVAPVYAEPAEVLPRAKTPEDVGLSSERLARVRTVTAGHIETGHVPGAVILVARHGKIAYFESLGFRDRAAGAPMTKDALFRIYSMTKPITSVAVMMLVEEGRLQISDPVSPYLPALSKPKVGVEKPDGAGGKTLGRLPLLYAPATRWE